MNNDTDYKPWLTDYWIGFFFLLISMIGGWGLVLNDHYILSVLILIWSLSYSKRFIASGFARENGMDVEIKAVNSFLLAMSPDEFSFKYDVKITKLGVCVSNIDLLINSHETQASFCVEIKAYSGIVEGIYGWRRLGKAYRLWSPQKQVKGQCRYLGKNWHFPIIWLPESKLNNWFISNNILVVNGNVDLLIDGLRKLNKVIYLPVYVQFPYAPSWGIRDYLKSRGYSYDGNLYRWYGFESRASISSILEVSKLAHGNVYWLQR